MSSFGSAGHYICARPPYQILPCWRRATNAWLVLLIAFLSLVGFPSTCHLRAKGVAASLSLYLHYQYGAAFESNGMAGSRRLCSRLPPWSMGACALLEAGGAWRRARARVPHEFHGTLGLGLARLGLPPFFSTTTSGADHLASVARTPSDPRFRFGRSYAALAARGFIIYPAS